jgi:glycosyltransferase involved in cell wall biosynthesis
MEKEVKSRLNTTKYDVVLLFEMSTIQYCPSSCFHEMAVFIEDPQSIRLHRLAQLSICSLWRRVKLYILSYVTSGYENRVLPKMGEVFLLSEEDASDMRKQGSFQNLACVPYGVEQRAQMEIGDYKDRERAIVFSGNMFHLPNIDGALFLLDDIFPLILRECPSAVLWIVGADPDKRIFAAAEKFGKQIVITGRVDDVSGYIKRATVSVCPVQLKIGVQTKILESLSWGTPVVTTSAGNSGVGGTTGTHLWVEDEASMLAQRICELLRGQNWNTLSNEGRKLAMERFSWENSAAQLERHLEALVEKN